MSSMTRHEIDTMLKMMQLAIRSDSNKMKFRCLAMKFLHQVQAAIDPDADVRFNPGGPSVPGDAILHGRSIYILIGGSGVNDWILYRTCDGKRDYSGHDNHQYTHARLSEYGVKDFIEYVTALLKTGKAMHA